MFHIKKIMVPTDLTSHSTYVMRYAAKLAEQFGAEIHLVHVVEPVPVVYYEAAMFTEESAAKLVETARKLMHKMPESPWSTGTKVVHEVMEGAPITQIVNYAKEHGIDLIVAGTHGRTGVGHLLLGSLAEKIVRMAPCPVLTIRKPEEMTQL